MIDRNGDCVVSDRNSGLNPGESLFSLIDERGSFVGGSAEEERIRSVLARGDTVNVPIVFDGRSEYLYFYPLGHAEWYLCTVMPYSVIEGDIGDLSGTIAANAAIVGVAVLLFVLLVFLIYYRMARRNTRLLAEEKDRAERAFAEAQQASLAKTEFLSRMSHEIRTPMNGIMGMTAIALESIGDDGKVRTCLEKVTLSSEHLLSLINDILDMSKIESGKIDIKRETFDFGTFVGSLDDVFGTQALEQGIRYKTEEVGALPSLLVGDGLRLNQIVYNLVGNAFKFTPRDGSVTLRIEELPAPPEEDAAHDDAIWLRFSVTDTGCGIKPENRERIFSSFEQGDESSCRRGGTGLGLAITKRFTEMMGGRISLSSEVGKGSTFTVDVPFGRASGEGAATCDDAFAARSRTHGDGVSYDFSGRRVIVAEDNELNREIACCLLDDAGYEVDTAENGEVALGMIEAADARAYDLVLMDIQMPVMDGYAATRAIRALPDPVRASLPIIAVSANAFSEDRKRSLESGMDAHLPKPLDVHRLQSLIEKVVH